jgi:tetratricopeptide (TPR) repeat protein
VVTAYDDARQTFTVQDTYIQPDLSVSYDQFLHDWRAFNFTYLVIYPPGKDVIVRQLMGEALDVKVSYQQAAQKASDEIFALGGVDQYFAWFNRGSSLVGLQDYAGAAEAYDEAFALYPSIPEAERPWRMLWYQTGPYFAYFYTGRYYDVLNLADTTLNAMQSDRNLEESYYWRGMAKAALGDISGAIEDYRLSLEYHPGFGPAEQQLAALGAQP